VMPDVALQRKVKDVPQSGTSGVGMNNATLIPCANLKNTSPAPVGDPTTNIQFVPLPTHDFF